MTANITIRPEEACDFDAIYTIIKDAFAPMPYAAGDEQDLVNTLRDSNALSVALVAVDEGRVVGHIAFSPATASDGSERWYALGPVAVMPGRQTEGIGSMLINTGIKKLNELNATGCILVGNPDYYCRFGFELSPANVPPGEPPEFFQIKLLTNHRPTGPIGFHPAFHPD